MRRLHALLLLLITLLALPAPLAAVSAPEGFIESRVAQFTQGTQMAIAPDGRVFVALQNGAVRVIKNDALLPTPFVTVTTIADDERGLVGICLDPQFASNGYVYLNYTVQPTPGVFFNRIVRYMASGDVAASGSEAVLFDLEPQINTYHLGGAIRFSGDGKLLIPTGDNDFGFTSQAMDTLNGKILRINKDGSIPSDNPYYATLSGKLRAIYAKGVRNTFTLAVQPGTGMVLMNDVGGDYEEINLLAPGANFGWNMGNGPSVPVGTTAPFYYYPRTVGTCIVGSAFYNPTTIQFPAQYVGKLFVSDHTAHWIKVLDPANPGAGFTHFCTTTETSPVDIQVAPSGSLYYQTRGAVFKLSYAGTNAPFFSIHPQSQSRAQGETVTFTVAVTGTPAPTLQWLRNGSPIVGATGTSYSFTASGISNFDRFSCQATNSSGSVTSQEAIFTITTNQAPQVTITAPAVGAPGIAMGDTIAFAATATDPEDGARPASAFTWKIDWFQNGSIIHPGLPDTSGMMSGTYLTPTVGPRFEAGFYRIYCTVVDSGGRTTTVTRDVQVRHSQLTLATVPTGLQLLHDGASITAPNARTVAVGLRRPVEAPATQVLGGTTYAFSAWSNGGARSQTVNPGDADATLTATYVLAPSTAVAVVDWQGDFVNGDAGWAGGFVAAGPMELGGGSGTDHRRFMKASDVAAKTPGGAGPGSSRQFFGGIQLHAYNRNFDYEFAELWGGANVPGAPNDRIYYGTSFGTHGWMLVYWQKEDFLSGADRTLTFDSTSEARIESYLGGDGGAGNNLGRARIVVRDGTQWWISQDFAAPAGAAADFVLGSLSTRAWAPYAPSYGTDLRFNAGAAVFTPRSFASITAAGVYHSNDNVPMAQVQSQRAGFNFRRFRITAVPGGGTNAAPVIAGVTANPSFLPNVTTSVLTCTASDDGGAAGLSYGWELVGGVSGGSATFTANHSSAAASTTVQINKPGQFIFLVRVTDQSGRSASQTVTINADNGLASIQVTPPSTPLAPGASRTFTAQPRDQFGNPQGGTVTWSVVGGGSITQAGVYTAPAVPGVATVRASIGAIMGTAAVTIAAPGTGPGDLNGNGVVDAADLTLVTANFGKRSTDAGFVAAADANGDGLVNLTDMGIVTANYGATY